MDPKDLKLLESQQPMRILDDSKLLRGLFYGDFGSGKTTLAGMIIEELQAKALAITTDSAWTVLQKSEYCKENIDRRPFANFQAVRAMVHAHNEGIEPWSSYSFLLWDTVSTSINLMLRASVAVSKFPNQQMHKDIEAYPHYRMVANALSDTVQLIKDSDLHVIYTAHTKEPSEQDTKRVKKRYAIRPNANEMAYQVLGQEVNLIGWQYRETNGSANQIQFEPTLTETAKSQIPTIDQTTYKVSEVPGLIKQWVQG